MKYQLYIVKKYFVPLEIEAGSQQEAEEKAYNFLEENGEDGKYDSDDTYIYFDGEMEEA